MRCVQANQVKLFLAGINSATTIEKGRETGLSQLFIRWLFAFQHPSGIALYGCNLAL